MRLLSSLKEGEKATIKSYTNDALSLKLIEMGCTPGSSVELIKKAPFNGPIIIKVWNYQLCLRLEEAKEVTLVQWKNST